MRTVDETPVAGAADGRALPGSPDAAYWAGVSRIVLIVTTWSTIGLTVRLMTTASALEISAGRTAVMTVCLLAWVAVRGVPVRLPFHDPRSALPIALVATFFTTGSTLTIVAMESTRIANVACIGATAPLVAAVVAPWATGERTTPGLWLACAAAVLGVWLVVGPGSPGTPNLGDLAALGSAAAFGCQLTALRRFSRVDLIPAYILGGIATATVGVVLAGGFAVNVHDALLMLVMGTIQLALPAVMLLRQARHVPAVDMALLTLLDVVLGPLWVWLLLGERVSATAAAGGAVVVAAVVLATMQAGRRGR